MKTTYSCLSVLFVATTLLASAANAQFTLPPLFPPGTIFPPAPRPVSDAKLHAGSFCQALVGAQAGRINTVSFGIENVGPFDTTVTCPILRDNVFNTTGLGEVSDPQDGVRLRVFNPGNKTLPCTLFSFDPFRSAVATHSVSASGQGDQILALDVATSSAGGQYSIICTLPPKARIYNYWVKEFPDTNRS